MMGNCYESSVKTMLEMASFGRGGFENLRLAHGNVTGQTGYVKDQRYGHAWLELEIPDKFVFDTEQNAMIPKDRYYQVGNIDCNEVKLYDLKEVRGWLTQTEHYGPWEMAMTDFEKTIQDNNPEEEE
jgi:hypothetical protein